MLKIECPRCETEKSDSEFYLKRGRKGGYCKPCAKEVHREWLKKNKVAHRETDRAWRAANKERCREIGRRKRELNGHRINAQQAERRAKAPRKYRSYELKAKYGLTIEAYEALVVRQNGLCSCCKLPCAKLFVDHDHKTGLIRSLLCAKCNAGIGFFDEDPLKLAMAIEYVKLFKR